VATGCASAGATGAYENQLVNGPTHGQVGTPDVCGHVRIGGTWIAFAGSIPILNFSSGGFRFLSLGASDTRIVFNDLFGLAENGSLPSLSLPYVVDVVGPPTVSGVGVDIQPDRITVGNQFDSRQRFMRVVPNGQQDAWFSKDPTFAFATRDLSSGNEVAWRYRNGTFTVTEAPLNLPAPEVANSAVGVKF
jgi:hypothetical protein